MQLQKETHCKKKRVASKRNTLQKETCSFLKRFIPKRNFQFQKEIHCKKKRASSKRDTFAKINVQRQKEVQYIAKRNLFLGSFAH